MFTRHIHIFPSFFQTRKKMVFLLALRHGIFGKTRQVHFLPYSIFQFFNFLLFLSVYEMNQNLFARWTPNMCSSWIYIKIIHVNMLHIFRISVPSVGIKFKLKKLNTVHLLHLSYTILCCSNRCTFIHHKTKHHPIILYSLIYLPWMR